MRRIITSFVITLAVMLASLSAVIYAYSSNPPNTVNRTKKTAATDSASCGGCHSPAAPDTAIAATFSGPTQLYPGDYGNYQIVVSKTTTAAQRVGFDVAASDTENTLTVTGGEATTTLANGTSGGEVTHSSGLTPPTNLAHLTANTALYSFRYTCPATATAGSIHTLYGVVALGATGTAPASTTSGWNYATNATITAKALPTVPTTVSAGTPTSSSVPLSWSGGGPQYRVLAKIGTFATSATDGATTTAYEGSGTSVTATGLAAATAYYISAFSKDLGVNSGASFFSTTAAQTTATTGAALDPNPWVDAVNGSDSNAGSVGAPFKTIKKALTAVGASGTIHVAAGTYNTALGETFPITVPSGIKLQSTVSASSTIIDATGANQTVLICSGNANTTLVEGFTITGGLSASGGGIYSSNLDQTTVSRCIITGNQARGSTYAYGGGAFLNAPTMLVNCIISNNTALGGDGVGSQAGGDAHGAGVYGFSTTGEPHITNCTFYGNTAQGGNGGASGGAAGGALYPPLDCQTCTITNNIFANDTALAGSGSGTPPIFGGVSANNGTNNLFFPASESSFGTNALVNTDPLFVSAPSDLHLRSSSPARRAGTNVGAPTVDLDNNPRTSPPTIGAYEIGLYLTATAGIGRITVTWPGVVGASSYNLYISQSPGVTTSMFQTKITGATSPYVLSPLPNNATYYFVITAVENGIEGPISPEVSATSANGTWVKALVQAANGAITGSNFTSITRDLASGTTVYATAYPDPVSLYKSTDGGTTWNGVAGPFAGSVLHAVAANGQTIMVAGAGTIYRSIDGGSNWTTPVTGGGIGEDFVAGLAIDPLATGNVYAGDFHINGGSTSSDLLAKSVNGGASFVNIIDASSTNLRGYFLQVDPAIAGTLYAAGSGTPNVGKSTNNGATWSSVSPVGGYPQSLAIAPSSTLVLFAGMRDASNSNSLGVYKTANGGTNWSPMNTGLPVTLPDVSALLVDPSSVMRVHAGTTAGYYTTVNGATTWTLGPSGGPYPSAGLTGFNAFAQTTSRRLLASAATGVYMLALDPAPTISTVTPSGGNTIGGTPVTVNGTGFVIASGLRVLFGGVDGVINMGGSNSTAISVTSPAHAGGIVDVVVINPDGQAALSTNAFTYTCTTTIAPISASYSSAAASGSVQVTTGNGCPWTATAPGGSFVAITSGSSGSASGTVQYSVGLNATSNARTTTLTIAGQPFVVSQSASGLAAMALTAAASNGQVALSWSSVTGATSYVVQRSLNGSAFNPIAAPTTTTYLDNGVTNRNGYLYQVTAFGPAGVLAYSNVDLAVPFDYTYPTLSVGSTVIHAIDFAELRLALNDARAALGWPALSFTDGSLSGAVVKRIHLIELRNGVDGVRAGVGLSGVGYTDPTVTANSTTIKAAHVLDLRGGLQ